MLAAVGISALIMLFMWLLRGIMLTPVRVGRNARIETRLYLTGSCPELEETIDALLWLRQNGTLRAEITVVDAGTDEATRDIAEILARHGVIKLQTEVSDERE